MSGLSQIHWHEGLFLRPQHLQRLQRGIVEGFAAERRLSRAHAFGVLEYELSADALEAGRVTFDRLRAIMPSGIEVDAPRNAEPASIDIGDRVKSGGSVTVSLATPVWHSSRANTASNGDAGGLGKHLYRVRESDVPDENTGLDPQPVPYRMVNARLVVDGDDVSDLEVLPIVRLVNSGDADARPIEDKTFIPPCCGIHGSPVLASMLRDLSNAVEAARRDQVAQLTRGGFSHDRIQGHTAAQLLRLQALNRATARLRTLIDVPLLSPLEMYMELRDIQAELAGLNPDTDPFDAPGFEHERPGHAFFDLDRAIRGLLRSEGQGAFMKVSFEPDGRSLVAKLEDEHFVRANRHYLGVKTRENPNVLAKLLENEDSFKLMPLSMKGLKILGLRLERESYPPLAFPAGEGMCYFRIAWEDRESLWRQAEGDKALIIEWAQNEEFRYEAVDLFMTVPDA